MSCNNSSKTRNLKILRLESLVLSVSSFPDFLQFLYWIVMFGISLLSKFPFLSLFLLSTPLLLPPLNSSLKPFITGLFSARSHWDPSFFLLVGLFPLKKNYKDSWSIRLRDTHFIPQRKINPTRQFETENVYGIETLTDISKYLRLFYIDFVL